MNKIKLFYFNLMVKVKIKLIILSLPKKFLPLLSYISKGQKLRSKLMYETAQIVNISTHKILSSATCLEILHTASIVHDDVIDGDSQRRGNKTLNSVLSWKQTVMIGNYLLLQNFYKLFKNHTHNLPLRLGLIEGIERLCNGEIIQGMEYSFKKPPSIKECMNIAEKKTGTLFGLSCKLPFLIGKCSKEQINFAENCGLMYGVIYQIIDDLQDMIQDLKFDTKGIFFKHWTMPFIFWQKLYPENFQKTFKNKKIMLTHKITNEITQKCISHIETLLKKLQKESLSNKLNKKFYNFILTHIETIAKRKNINLKCEFFYH